MNCNDISLQSLFQPIVSIKRKTVIGFEALTRGIIKNSKANILGYEEIYNLAKKEQCLYEFEKSCWNNALKSWKLNQSLYPDSVLFLNIDVSLLNFEPAIGTTLLEMINTIGIEPDHIVLELVEQQLKMDDILLSFVTYCHNQGFLIAIDDFGEAFSNLERLFLIQPDIIKITKRLLHARRYSEEYGKSLLYGVIELINHIGAIPLLEGVETIDQLYEAVDCNIDIIQGYIISTPTNENSKVYREKLQNTLKVITDEVCIHKMQNIEMAKIKSNYYFQVARHIALILEMECCESTLDHLLHSLLLLDEQFECMYLLSEEGIQISETHFRNLTSKNTLFKPAKKGDDHSEKEYYLYIKAGATQYYSSPYISQATGMPCVTISLTLSRGSLLGKILCIDFKS